MKNRRFLIFFSIILVLIIGLAAAYVWSKQIPMNDNFTVGNNPGNLYNSGLFLELDGKVYFSNPLGNNCLYSMNPDETDLKELTVMAVRNIVGAKKNLYYYMDYSSTSANNDIKGLGKVSTFYGLYRSNLKGEEQELLDREDISDLQLVGNQIYYSVINGSERGLHTIKINGKHDTFLTSELINPNCALDGRIYYSGVDEDHNLHVMDTLSDNAESTVLEGNIWQPIISGDYVYYINAAGNHYHLYRTNLNTKAQEKLCDARVDFYNMNDYNIFYVTSKKGEEALHVMNLDGSGDTIIANGVFHDLNLTSRYLYFKPFDVENVLYHVPVDGSEPVSTFLPFNK